MENSTTSPNGTNNGYAGAAATHTLADPAAEHMFDTILATPFAEADPPADLPPADDIEPEIPAEIPPELPPIPDDNAPQEAEPTAEPTTTEPPAEPPAEPEAPTAEHDASLDEDPEDDTPAAPPAADREWQVGNFAVYKGKYVVEITKIFPASELGPATFSGHAVFLQNEDGSLVPGKPIVVRPVSALTPIVKVTTLLKLKIGLELRLTAEHDRIALGHANAAEQLKTQLATYIAAKQAIVETMPDTAGLTW